jgi:hypothetical protein
MSGSPSTSSSTSSSSPTSSQTVFFRRRLWIEYAECGCTYDFKKRWFGLFHWLQYTKLRYWWRWVSIRIKYPYGKPGWYPGSDSDHEDIEYGDLWPVLMTNEEFDHWFGDE